VRNWSLWLFWWKILVIKNNFCMKKLDAFFMLEVLPVHHVWRFQTSICFVFYPLLDLNISNKICFILIGVCMLMILLFLFEDLIGLSFIKRSNLWSCGFIFPSYLWFLSIWCSRVCCYFQRGPSTSKLEFVWANYGIFSTCCLLGQNGSTQFRAESHGRLGASVFSLDLTPECSDSHMHISHEPDQLPRVVW
jgi:hypothetical protein